MIAFPQIRELAETGGPVSRKRRTWGDGCRHDHGVIVDSVDRTVECKACHKPVDAFDALASLAAAWDWEHTREAMAHARKEAAKLEKHIERLKSLRVRERRKGYVSAEAVRRAFTDAVKRIRRAGGEGAGYAANWIEGTLREVLDGADDPG